MKRISCILFSVGVAFLLATASGCEDRNSKGQLETLRRLAAETPNFPDFKQVHSYDNNKLGQAILSLYFQSSAKDDDVKRFYSKLLAERGWSSPGEEPLTSNFGFTEKKGTWRLTFRKGEYQMVIAGDPDPTSAWCNYAISYVWKAR
jgi:hypothetical protein